MKEFNIELIAAAKYAKGTRLFIKIKKEGFLGTVTATRMGEVYLLLDNGEKVKAKEKSKLILGEGIKRKIKKPINLNSSNYAEYLKDSGSKDKKVIVAPNSKTSSINASDKTIKKIVEKEIARLGNKADLNHINTSKVTNMESLFYKSSFNGDISKWDVSNVKTMKFMFLKSSFNGDISKWDVSNVENMDYMFEDSKFSGNIRNWNVSKVRKMTRMFNGSPLNFENFKDFWNLKSLIQEKKLPYTSDKPNPKLTALWNKFKKLDTNDYFELQYNIESKMRIVSKKGDMVGGPAITILEKLGFKERVLFGKSSNNDAYGTMSKDNLFAKIEFDHKNRSTTYYTFVTITEEQ